MATLKISELTSTSATPDFEIPGSKTGVTKKTTVGSILAILPVSTVTANEEFTPARAGTMVRVNSGTALTFTISPDATTPWPDGAIIGIRQVGAGHAVISGTGVTLSPTGPQTFGGMSEIYLHRVSADVWDVTGDVA